MTRLDSVERAVADIAAGKAVVVIDDEERENEGDLIFAAEKATPELVAFMVRYTSGYLCVPLDGAVCDRLGLLPMYAVNQDKHGTAYTVTVDAKNGVGTGISASDRATTVTVVGGAVLVLVDRVHRQQPEPVTDRAIQRHTQVARRVAHHERDEFRGGLLGGENQVALVLAFLVVDDDDGLTRGDVSDSPLDGIQPRHHNSMNHRAAWVIACSRPGSWWAQ